MKFSKKILWLLCLLLCSTHLFAGFVPETKVFLGNGSYKQIKDLKVGEKIAIYSISSRGILKKRHRIKEKTVKRAREVVALETKSDFLLIGKGQKLYNRRTYKFIPAQEFRAGDKLFSPEKGNLTVIKSSIYRLEEELDLHEISIDVKNLFLIQTQNKTNILAHNFAIAIPIFSYIGGKLILPTLAVLATAVFKGVAEHAFEKRKKKKQDKPKPEEPTEDFLDDAQAPGKPTEDDGYKPPKKWDGKKAKHPKTGQHGYPDKKGKVWVPTGPGSLAHGGPHWDVINKDGGHENIMPGGGKRGEK